MREPDDLVRREARARLAAHRRMSGLQKRPSTLPGVSATTIVVDRLRADDVRAFFGSARLRAVTVDALARPDGPAAIVGRRIHRRPAADLHDGGRLNWGRSSATARGSCCASVVSTETTHPVATMPKQTNLMRTPPPVARSRLARWKGGRHSRVVSCQTLEPVAAGSFECSERHVADGTGSPRRMIDIAVYSVKSGETGTRQASLPVAATSSRTSSAPSRVLRTSSGRAR